MLFDHHPFTVNENGHLEIGNVDTIYLARKYGTPLYVYDVSLIRKNCRSFVDAFKALNVKAQVAYASKAFSSIAILQVVNQENLSLDVVSEGELYTALRAGFPTEKIHFHGNNKTESELKMAIEHKIGCIVIDNFYEIDLLDRLLRESDQSMDVLIRVTPGIEANTHEYIMTGNEDSKFGFCLSNGQADRAFQRLKNHPYLKFKGLHAHIGSQIFETEAFLQTNKLLFSKIAEWHASDQYIPEVLNLGGGFGIQYTKEDRPLPHEEFIKKIVVAVKEEVEKLAIPMPEIWIEPGRSIVGNAGITLYTIGSQKDIPGIRKYISVDGGMTDNLRPALYNAIYEGVIANKANEQAIEEVSIAGKCCESGDMLMWDISVPKIESGDILAMFSTGAYGFSMASNYNRFERPAVVFVENGEAKLVVKRESLDDIIKNDLAYL